MKYYAAYGSNLNVKQMARRCPAAKPVGSAGIADYELLFRGSRTGSYLTIEQKRGASVPAVVWEVTRADEQNLDYYEGYPEFYYKAPLKLDVTDFKTKEVKTLNCFVYIMYEDRPVGIPANYYIASCLEGYRHFGIDPQPLYDAIERSVNYEKI